MNVIELLDQLSNIKNKRKAVSVTNMGDSFDHHFIVTENHQTVNIEIVVGEHDKMVRTVNQLIDELLQVNFEKAVIINCRDIELSEAKFEISVESANKPLEIIMNNYMEA